jgi:hypothetical protein
MADNICFEKVWQDELAFKLKVTCKTEFIAVSAGIYAADEDIGELQNAIQEFLYQKIDNRRWMVGAWGDSSVAAMSLEFRYQDKQGHILIEVFLELDDGGSLDEHHCCFYVKTEWGLLDAFCRYLDRLKAWGIGARVELNSPF